jgi:hypothetical protein
VARATTVVAKSLLSRMDWLEMRAPSHLRGESALQELKLGKLKDKALVNGRSAEKKSVNINKR